MSKQDSEFFVGYLPAPPGQRRFLMLSAAAIALFLCLVAVVVAAGQSDPGDGHWYDDEQSAATGVVHESPYPMIETASGNVLLVNTGKIGASQRVKGHDGQVIRAKGTRIERGEVHLFELDDANDAISADSVSYTAKPATSDSGGEVVLQGEVTDPKCYSGAMKPGEGKTHKACAVLCLRGGIPPVLITMEGTYVLVDEYGNGLIGASLEGVLPFVGDPVLVRGRIEQRGDLRMLKIEPGAVRRK